MRPFVAIWRVTGLGECRASFVRGGTMPSPTNRSSMSGSMVKNARDLAEYWRMRWSLVSASWLIFAMIWNSNSLLSRRHSPDKFRMQLMQYVSVSRSVVLPASSIKDFKPPSSTNCVSICSLKLMFSSAAAHFLFTRIFGSSTGFSLSSAALRIISACSTCHT